MPTPTDPIAPLKHEGDLTLAGPVTDGRVVHVSGSLTVDGAVEAVTLSTGAAFTVSGGIIGKQKGRYTVGGALRCRFVTGGTLMTRGDVTIDSELTNARLTCTGRLDVSNGVLCGGDVAANGGVACHTLGHACGLPTVVEAGEGRALRLLTESITAQIEDNRKRVAAVRAGAEPLLKMLKSLRPEQRERVTELLYEASELEANTAKMLAASEQRKKLIRQQADPRITVADVAYAGVVVRFGPVEARLMTPLKGPLTLTVRKGEGGTEVVVIDAADGRACVLPSRGVENAAAA